MKVDKLRMMVGEIMNNMYFSQLEYILQTEVQALKHNNIYEFKKAVDQEVTINNELLNALSLNKSGFKNRRKRKFLSTVFLLSNLSFSLLFSYNSSEFKINDFTSSLDSLNIYQYTETLYPSRIYLAKEKESAKEININDYFVTEDTRKELKEGFKKYGYNIKRREINLIIDCMEAHYNSVGSYFFYQSKDEINDIKKVEEIKEGIAGIPCPKNLGNINKILEAAKNLFHIRDSIVVNSDIIETVKKEQKKYIFLGERHGSIKSNYTNIYDNIYFVNYIKEFIKLGYKKIVFEDGSTTMDDKPFVMKINRKAINLYRKGKISDLTLAFIFSYSVNAVDEVFTIMSLKEYKYKIDLINSSLLDRLNLTDEKQIIICGSLHATLTRPDEVANYIFKETGRPAPPTLRSRYKDSSLGILVGMEDSTPLNKLPSYWFSDFLVIPDKFNVVPERFKIKIPPKDYELYKKRYDVKY